MGSGKTRVGRSLAWRLGWAFADFDEEIERRTGLSIPVIFRELGEGFFREVEEDVGSSLLSGSMTVLASGGGWPAMPGRMEGLPPDTFSVWLKVTPEEALKRAAEEGPTRPLLDVPDPLGRVRELMGEREPFYKMAHVAIDSMGADPEDLAVQIEEFMKSRGPNPLRSKPPHE
jgi:shikimate kinase